MQLGAIGKSECIPTILEALADDNDYVRSYAMMGIERGIVWEHCSPEFLEAVFPALTKLLDREDRTVSGTAPRLLIAINAERAMSVLLSAEYFTITNKQLCYMIDELNKFSKSIPHDRLLPLLHAVKSQPTEYPYDHVYGAALIAYARNPDDAAEEQFRAAMRSPNKRISESAAKALAVYSGVPDPLNVVLEAEELRGFQSLSAPRKHYCAIYYYDFEMNNGGHMQYFCNESGNYWKWAIRGLREIESPERCKILQRGVAQFEPDDPSADTPTRLEQLACFTPEQIEALKKLDEAYYACEENVSVLLCLYAIKHKEHFIAGRVNEK